MEIKWPNLVGYIIYTVYCTTLVVWWEVRLFYRHHSKYLDGGCADWTYGTSYQTQPCVAQEICSFFFLINTPKVFHKGPYTQICLRKLFRWESGSKISKFNVVLFSFKKFFRQHPRIRHGCYFWTFSWRRKFLKENKTTLNKTTLK